MEHDIGIKYINEDLLLITEADKPPTRLQKAMNVVRRLLRRPEKRNGPLLISLKDLDRTSSRAKRAPTKEDIAALVEKKEEKIRAPRPTFTIDVPVQAPPATAVEDTSLEIPAVEPPKQDKTEQLRTKQIEKRLDTTSRTFLMGLNNYLGLPAGLSERPNFIEHVLATHGQQAAERGSDIAGRMLHLQILSLIDRYRGLDTGAFVETEYGDITKSLNRLHGIINLYKVNTEHFQRLVQQNKYPQYDEHFLNIMGNTVNAFTAWDHARTKTIPDLPTQVDQTQLDDPEYTARFRDPSSEFVMANNPSQEDPLPHPQQADLDNQTYNAHFRSDVPRTAFDIQTPERPTPQTPSQTHPNQELLNDVTYQEQFTNDSVKFPLAANPPQREPEAHPQQEHLDDPSYQKQFTADAETTFTPNDPPKNVMHGPRTQEETEREAQLADPAFNDQFKPDSEQQT